MERVAGGQRVGVLGGGQLARMMALAGIPLGMEFAFLDPSPEACAGRAGRLHQAAFADPAAARRMAAEIDVATYEFENVPADTARAIASERPFHPPVEALQVCQDRLSEKNLLAELGIATPAFRAVAARPELLAAIGELGFPAVLKTRRLGYDGKGQAVLQQQEDLEPAWQKLGGTELIVETFVPFEAECSILAVRGMDGDTRFWPLVRNVHDAGILALSQPGVFSAELQRQAEQIATHLLQHWQYVGVLTVEFFLHHGALLVNEMAPRVHNSGHWTIDAAVTSQFENHLRAISGLPLGDTALTRPALMFNWVGELPDKRRLLANSGLHWHEYGKSARPGRKVGHATLTAPEMTELFPLGMEIARGLGGNWVELLARML
jgi:5-(carboxyamino)imidazole ribonucleotide synthase